MKSSKEWQNRNGLASGKFNWDYMACVRLRELWNEGHSTSQIGLVFGVSKNAICGAVDRLNLTHREQPANIVSPPAVKMPDGIDRSLPMPAGHPISWRECLGMKEDYPNA